MNPLQQFYRQPKIYIQLPSKGQYYPEGTLVGDAENVPIFAMTGMDELIMKTPDALFNGVASVKLMESCCPYIKDGTVVPSIDVDTILAAIRVATFGDTMSITHTCTACDAFSDYEIPTQVIIEHYGHLSFNNRKVIGDLTILFRPLSYGEMTAFNIENFTLQKMLLQLSKTAEYDERQQHLTDIYKKLSMVQAAIFVKSIESIQFGDTVVNDPLHISEWLSNCDSDYYNEIKSHLEANKEIWSVPKTKVKCMECGNEDLVDVVLDQSHFFG